MVGIVPAAALFRGMVGIVLDGVLRHAVAAEPDGAGGARFSVPLTDLSPPATVDVEDLSTGRRLLPEPLATADEFRLDELAFDGVVLGGSFSLAWAPGPFLPVAFRAGEETIASGVALHDPRAGGEDGRAVFRFRMPLAMLPPGPVQVVPSVSSVPRPDAVRELVCPYSGHVDAVEGVQIRGWVANAAAPEQPVRVELRRRGAAVAATTTNQPRPDVANVIPGAELCGFVLPAPVHERMRGGDEPYRVVIGGTDTELRGGVVHVPGMDGQINSVDEALGATVTGWALDSEVDGPVPVEVWWKGQVVGSGLADRFRADLVPEGLGAPGLPPGYCAFSIRVAVADATRAGEQVEVFAAGHLVRNSPVTVAPNPNLLRFVNRAGAVRPAVLPRLRAFLDARVGRRSVSLVLPAAGIDPDVLSTTLASVAGQWCARWELLCVHDAFAEPSSARVIAQFARRDPRIRMVAAATADGSGAALSAGLAAVRSGYAAVLRPEDRLEPDAVYQLLRAVNETGADVLFTDACITVPGTGQVVDIAARAAFSEQRFRSAPFWPDLLCMRTSLAQSLPQSDGVAFAAHAVSAAETVAHVPAVAVARPPAPESAPAPLPAIPFEGTLLAVVVAEAAPAWLGALPVACRVVVLGNAPRPAAVNAAVAARGAGCEALMLVGDGVEDPGPDTVLRLLSVLAGAGVGACGPVLIGPVLSGPVLSGPVLNGQVGNEERVVAAGLVVGAGLAGAACAVPAFAGGALAQVGGAVRDVSALPGALLLVRTDAWATVAGFQTGFAGGLLCEADLCLRMAAAGRSVLLDGGSRVRAGALPSIDAGDRLLFVDAHRDALRRTDPCYNPFLADDGSWLLRGDDGCSTVHRARVTTRQPPPPPQSVAAPEPVAEPAPAVAAKPARKRRPKGADA